MLVLVGALHLPSLFNPFFIDDYVYIDTVHDLGWADLGDLFTTSTMGEEASSVWWTPTGALPFYRPLGELTFAVDYRLWRLNPFGYHLTNLLLHLLCALLTWRLVRRLSDAPGVALTVATLFAIHPVHTEAVLWISGRFDLLVCASTLASVLAYFNWRSGGYGAWAWGLASVACYVIGLGAKETALILPAVIVAGECLQWRGLNQKNPEAPHLVSRLVAVTPYAVLSLIYLAGRFAMFGGLGTLPPPYGLDTSSATVAIKALLWNLSQYLLDFALFIQVDAIYLSDYWARHLVVLTILVALCVGIIAVCARLTWSTRLFRVGMVWSAAFTAPCLLAMPGERNVYLASVGVAMVLAGAACAANWFRKVTKVVVAVCVVMVLVEQATMWVVASTGEKVFRDLLILLPDPPPESQIYVVNQCPLNAVGFEQALNLRYRRDDIRACALSLAPSVEGIAQDTVHQTGVNSIRITREGGSFFESFVERFHLFSRESASDLATAAQRFDFELRDPPASLTGLKTIELRLSLPLDDPRLHLFIWNNQKVRGKMDYLRLPQLTHLDTIDPSDLSPSTDPR